MGFDWGSFLGGIVGALAAFCAAYLSYYLQRNTARARGRIELSNRIINWSRKGQHELDHNCPPFGYVAANVVSESLLLPLEDLMPLAAETDRKTFEAMDETHKRIMEHLDTFWSRPMFMPGNPDPAVKGAINELKVDVSRLHQIAIESRHVQPIGIRFMNACRKFDRWLDEKSNTNDGSPN